MNERIKELSEQAQLYARQGMGKCVIELKRFDKDAISERYAKDFEEKFAELIVRECIQLAVNEEERFNNMDQGELALAMENFQGLLKEHFGMEK